MNLPRKLQEWLQQPGTFLGTMEKGFIRAAQEYAHHGVGYGFMQQVAEWLWEEYCEYQRLPGGAWGPESHQREVAAFRAELNDLLAALKWADAVMDAAALRGIQDWLGEGPSMVWAEAHLRVRAALEKARGKS